MTDGGLGSLSLGRSGKSRSRFEIALARSEAEVLEAQRLRYFVFAQEMGASLPNRGGEIDRDEFDPHCEHLLVRDRRSGRVVGTYRILSAESSRTTGGFYSEREFDLENLSHIRSQVVEVGRACVDPAFRNGAVIVALWAGLARYIQGRRCRYVIGCGSIPAGDGGHRATSVYRRLSEKHLSPFYWRVFPQVPFPLRTEAIADDQPIPPLIRGYIQMGAYVCGDPAWDKDFNTADLFIMLPVARMNGAHARHFFGQNTDAVRRAIEN